MKFSGLVLAILLVLILALIFYDISKKGPVFGEEGDESFQGEVTRDAVRSQSENRRTCQLDPVILSKPWWLRVRRSCVSMASPSGAVTAN